MQMNAYILVAMFTTEFHKNEALVKNQTPKTADIFMVSLTVEKVGPSCTEKGRVT